MKRYILGDPHGAHKAMLQCFERSGFNYKKDELIVLGDVCDGWPEVKECIDELLKVKNLIYILGNHDKWTLEWMTALKKPEWVEQGGWNTVRSYIPEKHLNLLSYARSWHTDEKTNSLFVHGGIDPTKSMEKQTLDTCLWDRDLLSNARFKHNQKPDYKYAGFDHIFVGHTTTLHFKSLTPVHFCNVWGLDTGAGWGGKLTIMDRDTKEYWQSDFSADLYPDVKGR